MKFRPYWVAYLFGGTYRGGWRPSLYRHVRKYYREGWRANGYTLMDWLLGRPPRAFREWSKQARVVDAVARPDGISTGQSPRV